MEPWTVTSVCHLSSNSTPDTGSHALVTQTASEQCHVLQIFLLRRARSVSRGATYSREHRILGEKFILELAVARGAMHSVFQLISSSRC